MNITENQIIGELVARDYRAAEIFSKYKIDFCCQGDRTIGQACEKKEDQSRSGDSRPERTALRRRRPVDRLQIVAA